MFSTLHRRFAISASILCLGSLLAAGLEAAPGDPDEPLRLGTSLIWGAPDGSWRVQADGAGTRWYAAGRGADGRVLRLGWTNEVDDATRLIGRRLVRIGPEREQAVTPTPDGVLVRITSIGEPADGNACVTLPLHTGQPPAWTGEASLDFDRTVTLSVRAEDPRGPRRPWVELLRDHPAPGEQALRVCVDSERDLDRWTVELELWPVLQSSSLAGGPAAEECSNGVDDDGDTLTDCEDPDCQTVDTDGDGVPLCAPDCDDRNATVRNVPSAIADLSLDAAGGLSWSPPVDPGADQIVYDLLRSSSSSDLSAATCIEQDDADLTAVDAAAPATGQLFAYLLRTQNGCPAASLGTDSAGTPRLSDACVEDCAAVGDDDGDGVADCADFDCIGNAACPEECGDLFDNDGDGATDCDDAECAGDAACLVCDLDGIYEPSAGEQCDDGGICAYDGCAVGSCDRESTVIFNFLRINTTGGGFDLDNADGDDDVYTGIDNFLGSNPTLADQFNAPFTNGIADGSLRTALTIGDLDSLIDDAEIVAVPHEPIDPDCPLFPVYDAANPPPWINSPPAEMYSDTGQFPACMPETTISDADDPANGLYPAANPNQPPAPVLRLAADPIPFGGLTLRRGILEATAGNDGSLIVSLDNGIAGGVATAKALWQIPGTALCPTSLHALLGLLGQPDIDLDPVPGGADTFNTATGFLPCIISSVSITSCVDAETGATIPNSDLDGDLVVEDGECVLDPRIADGYSVGVDFSTVELHIVESRDALTYCP